MLFNIYPVDRLHLFIVGYAALVYTHMGGGVKGGVWGCNFYFVLSHEVLFMNVISFLHEM